MKTRDEVVFDDEVVVGVGADVERTFGGEVDDLAAHREGSRLFGRGCLASENTCASMSGSAVFAQPEVEFVAT